MRTRTCVEEKVHQIIERLIKSILEVTIKDRLFDIFPTFSLAQCSRIWNLNNCFKSNQFEEGELEVYRLPWLAPGC